MLVLSRKLGQSVVIDGTTVVRILEIKGNQIRLGIEAPDHVSILRSELQEPKDRATSRVVRCPSPSMVVEASGAALRR
jgi:carbon storage regulator